MGALRRRQAASPTEQLFGRRAALPSGCVVTVYRKAVKLGARVVADRVGWFPDLGARPNRGEVLKALLRGASALGGGRLLLALPRPEVHMV